MTDTVKGFRDIEDSRKRIVIRNKIEEVFRLYDYKAVETPTIEYEKFVKGENTNDEAVSDIFKLKDKGKRNLALRYEFTFQLKRLAKNKKLPYKRYQIGKVFRDEPIAGNRWREFTQCDVDVVGSGVKNEAEILKITSEILNDLGINFVINFNNRKLLNEILDDLGVKDNEKVIKELDKLDKLNEKEVRAGLKKLGAEGVLRIFKKPEKYFEKYESYNEIRKLKKDCNLYGVNVNFQPFLARGLAYYNGSVFEVKSDLKESIAAGGSYLINGIQSTGISFGLDRMETISKVDDYVKRVLVISLNQDKKAVEVAEKIRGLGVSCSVFYGKPGKALDYANSMDIPLVVFVGDEEVKKKKFKIKNMDTGKEKMISLKGLEKEIRG